MWCRGHHGCDADTQPGVQRYRRIIVGADGVTIDLGGFAIRNTCGRIVAGVKISGFQDVTVRNGTVRGFYRNIIFEDSPGGVALDLVIRGGGSGLIFVDSDNGVAKRIDTRNFPDAGFEITRSDEVGVFDSTVRRAGWGVFVVDSVGATVSNVDVRRNLQGVSLFLVRGTVVSDSIISNSWDFGVISEESIKIQVLRTTIKRNAIGVYFISGSDGGLVQDSRVVRNDIGVHLGSIGGPGLPFLADWVRVRNNAISNNRGSGIVIDQATTTGVPHKISDNTVNRNGADAVGLVDSLGAPLDDGIHIVAPSGAVELADNTARRNIDYGIEANVATDLGRNAARRNGNPAQCVGVIC